MFNLFQRSSRLSSILLVLVLCFGETFSVAAASACSLSADSEIAADRHVTVNIGCEGASWFRLSQDPDFHDTGDGLVKINIDEVAEDGTYADISVTYPNGVSGDSATPFYVQPASKSVKVLAVRFVFEDAQGNIAGMPAYATDMWLHSAVFGTGIGFDGQPGANSIREHIAQNTYGRVEITGETYPEVVRLPLEEYFDPFDLYPQKNMSAEIINAIIASDPTFLSGKEYDFLLGFSPDYFNVIGQLEAHSGSSYPDPNIPTQPTIKGYILSNMLITEASVLFKAIVDEQRISHSTTSVATAYDPASVQGVWLASDPGHLGTNYFVGGTLVGSRGDRYLALGTPLPANNVEVLVSYTPSHSGFIESEEEAYLPPNTLIIGNNNWYPRFLHELYHAISSLIAFNDIEMGDLYKTPAVLSYYDIMSSSGIRSLMDLLGDGVLRYYYEPAYLSGYSKMASDFIFPYTLHFGENATSIRLSKMEEGDFTDTNQRIKLIKIPLRPTGDPGYQRMVDYSGSKQYSGEEYLLLEWRHKGALPDGGRNFDAYLPSEGLMITHVVGNESYQGTNVTGFGYDIVRIIDATPPASVPDGFDDTATSPVLFGPDAGVLTYRTSDFWQEIDASVSAADFLLSTGSGTKTLFAEFADQNGNIVWQNQIALTLTDDSESSDRIPSQVVTSPQKNSLITTDPTKVTMTAYAPNTFDRTFVFQDGVELFDVSGDYTVDFIRFSDFSDSGFHWKNYVMYDEGGIRAEAILPFYVGGLPAENQPPVADAGQNQQVNVLNGDLATIVLDARTSSDPDGMVLSCAWLENGVLLSSDPVYALRRGVGTYTFLLRVTDNFGATSENSVTVTVTAPAPNLPPIANAGSPITKVDTDRNGTENVALNGSASSDPDGTIASYSWYENTTLLATGATPTVFFAVGSHSVRLVVTDNMGAQAEATVSVTVSSPREITDFSDSFEVGEWDGKWTEAGTTLWSRAKTNVDDGLYAAKLIGYVKGGRLTLANTINLSGRLGAELTFSWYLGNGVTNADILAVDVLVGSVWREIAIISLSNAPKATWVRKTIDLQEYLNSGFKFRFRGSMLNWNHAGFVDDVTVTSYTPE